MADRPKRPEADPQWQAIHTAAASGEADLTRLMLGYLLALAAWGEVQAALAVGDIERAVMAIPLGLSAALRSALAPLLGRVAEAGAAVALESPPMVAEIVIRLGPEAGLPTQALEDWARSRAASLVTAITAETRAALRAIVTGAVHRGASPALTASLLEAAVGLNRRQAAALARYQQALVDAKTPVTRLDRLVRRYGARLLRQRARAIARTETLFAANRGRQAVWLRDAQQGLIDPDRWEQEWVAIVPSDGRTCPTCDELDGMRAPIGVPFPAPGGDGPPQHTNCRCTVVLARHLAV